MTPVLIILGTLPTHDNNNKSFRSVPGDASAIDKSHHAHPDDSDKVGDKARQMRAKIQGHGPFLMTPFISLYEPGDITKDRRPPAIHFPPARLLPRNPFRISAGKKGGRVRLAYSGMRRQPGTVD